jgi:hypothetical protein
VHDAPFPCGYLESCERTCAHCTYGQCARTGCGQNASSRMAEALERGRDCVHDATMCMHSARMGTWAGARERSLWEKKKVSFPCGSSLDHGSTRADRMSAECMHRIGGGERWGRRSSGRGEGGLVPDTLPRPTQFLPLAPTPNADRPTHRCRIQNQIRSSSAARASQRRSVLLHCKETRSQVERDRTTF